MNDTTRRHNNADLAQNGSVKHESEFGTRPYFLRLLVPVCAAIAVSTTVLPKSLFITSFDKIYNIWIEGGRIRQTAWNNYVHFFNDDSMLLHIFGPWLASTIAYWGVGILFLLMDIYIKPSVLRKYKIQPGANEPVDPEKLKKAIFLVIFNQTIITIPFTCVYAYIEAYQKDIDIFTLPPIHIAILHIIGCVLLEEFGFYYGHRLLHHKSLYKHFHKLHHEWTAPVSVIAINCHPVEHIVSNLLPVSLGPLLFGSHVSTLCLWVFLANMFTVNEHSGYHLPFLPSAEAHDFHHFKFNNCYGVLGLLDYLHGTDKAFKKVEAGKRHRVLIGLKSAREIYPDIQNNSSTKKAS